MQQKGIITGRREMSSMLTHHGLQQLTTDPYWQGRNTMDEDQEGLVMGGEECFCVHADNDDL